MCGFAVEIETGDTRVGLESILANVVENRGFNDVYLVVME